MFRHSRVDVLRHRTCFLVLPHLAAGSVQAPILAISMLMVGWVRPLLLPACAGGALKRSVCRD